MAITVLAIWNDVHIGNWNRRLLWILLEVCNSPLVFWFFLFFMFLVLFVFLVSFLAVVTGLVVVVGRPVFAFLWFLLLLLLFLFFLRGRRFQLQRQLGLAQLHQRRHVVLFRLAARAAHVQHDIFVGVDFDEVTALERQMAGVPALLARRPSRRLLGETGELRLHRRSPLRELIRQNRIGRRVTTNAQTATPSSFHTADFRRAIVVVWWFGRLNRSRKRRDNRPRHWMLGFSSRYTVFRRTRTLYEFLTIFL